MFFVTITCQNWVMLLYVELDTLPSLFKPQPELEASIISHLQLGVFSWCPLLEAILILLVVSWGLCWCPLSRSHAEVVRFSEVSNVLRACKNLISACGLSVYWRLSTSGRVRTYSTVGINISGLTGATRLILALMLYITCNQLFSNIYFTFPSIHTSPPCSYVNFQDKCCI